MGYVIPSDWNRLIQDTSMQQIISGNPILKDNAVDASISDIKSYLRAKYDVDQEFSNTAAYNPQSTYGAGDRVYLDALAYSQSATYTTGQLTLQAGMIYQCSVAITIPELFNGAHWQVIGSQYDIFYGNYPYPVFDIKKTYVRGYKVWWKDHIYTCLVDSGVVTHINFIQYDSTNAVPYNNVFPDDPKYGAINWKDEGAYVIPAGNLLTTTPSETITLFQAREDEILVVDITVGLVNGTTTYVAPVQGQPNSLIGWSYSIERIGSGTLINGTNYTKNVNGFTLIGVGVTFNPGEKFVLRFVPITDQPVPIDTTGVSASQVILTYFTKGDNRNQQILLYTLDIAIYNLYRRIPPAIVPEIRIYAYNSAISWLKNVSKGDDVIADIMKLQPSQGNRIRYGSVPKKTNYY